jgi:uncharacterized protein
MRIAGAVRGERAICVWRRRLAAALTFVAFAVPAVAQTFPALSGRVVDAAQVLGPSARAELGIKLHALEAQTSHQLVVATVPSLNGHSVEDYANRLFRAWGLGGKDKNDGVLLLVAPTERKVRIEMGYGLESALPDAVAKLIIEQSIVPQFRAGDFAGGIARATDDIARVLTGDMLSRQSRATAVTSQVQTAPAGGDTEPVNWGEKLLLGAFVLFFAVVAAMFGFLALIVLAAFLVWLGLLPKEKDRQGGWLWLNYLNRDVEPDRLPARAHSRRSSHAAETPWSSSGSSDSSSSSSDSFSGGGGSSGGGGASGSW